MTVRPLDIDCDAVRDLAPLYALGALEPAEADAVRAHLATCEQPHPEVAELGKTAAVLLESVEPIEPPAGLKPRLLAAAEADLREGRHPSTAALAADADAAAGPVPVPDAVPVPGERPVPGAGPVPGHAPPPVVRLDAERARRLPSLAWLGLAAALIAALALGGWGLALRGQLAGEQAYGAAVDATLDLAAQPGSVSALLVGADGQAVGLGAVGSEGLVRLALRGLAPTTGSQVYTAWAIAGDAAPVPIGDLRVGSDGLAAGAGSSPVSEPGMVLALTLEPVAGATTPTLPIVASGVATTPAG